MRKKIILISVAIVLLAVLAVGLFLFAWYGQTLKITDFAGLGGLSEKPTKITMIKRIAMGGGDYRPYEYPKVCDVPVENMEAIMEKLFAIRYELKGPINRDPEFFYYLVIYDVDKIWTVGLGLEKKHNKRDYAPYKEVTPNEYEVDKSFLELLNLIDTLM